MSRTFTPASEVSVADQPERPLNEAGIRQVWFRPVPAHWSEDSSTTEGATMRRKTIVIVAGAALVAAAAIGTGVAVAAGGDDNEAPITGADLDRASAAALEATGGGRVTETEVGDEESYYEVEVTLDDGSQVDVQLDENFQVVGSSADEETEGPDDD
jgi:uncharacterized membrane protein YkoI